jgi:predicted Zn-dependent protease
VDPNLRHIGGVAARTATLALLAHSRDDERQADDLGLRYMQRAGYDPAAMTGVFAVLSAVSQQAGERDVPTWLMTHPDPAERQQRIEQQLGQQGPSAPDEAYLRRLDGIVFGEDPRDGVLVGDRFVHPRVGFTVRLPEGWKAAHQGAELVAISAEDDVIFAVAPSEAESAEQGLQEFFEDPAVQAGEPWRLDRGTTKVESAALALGEGDDRLVGLVAFVQLPARVLVALSLARDAAWSAHAESVARSVASVAPFDAAAEPVEPARIEVITLPRTTTLRALAESRASDVDVKTLGLINHVPPDASLPAGRALKWVSPGIRPGQEAQRATHAIQARGDVVHVGQARFGLEREPAVQDLP